MACSRAKARLNWVSFGQRRGRCKVRRRAERVIRPTRAKARRLRVLVITVRSPKRHVVQPDAVLEVAYGVLDLGVAAMIGLQFQRLPIAVGDEGVIAVSGEEGELGTGRRLHPPDNEPHRRGVRLGLERGVRTPAKSNPKDPLEGHRGPGQAFPKSRAAAMSSRTQFGSP